MRLHHVGRFLITAAVVAGLGGTAASAGAAEGGSVPRTTVPAAAAPALDAPGTTAAGTWEVSDIGTPPPPVWSLRYVQATVSGDVVATDGDTTILCWNGAAWTTIPRPDIPDASGTPIRSFGGVSCSDFFAFDSQSVPLRWHWNGQAWTSAPTGTKYAVNDFQVFAANDMVAIDHISKTAQRYNGTAWQSLPMPASLSNLHAIGGTSSTDLWLFGTAKTTYDFAAYHWNGTTWTTSATPASFADGGARNVVTVASNDMYVFDFNNNGGYLHWNGTAWQHLAIDTSSAYINGAAYLDGTVWISNGSSTYRLDNGTWTRVNLPAQVYGRNGATVLELAVDPRSGTLFGGGSAGGEQNPQGILLQLQS